MSSKWELVKIELCAVIFRCEGCGAPLSPLHPPECHHMLIHRMKGFPQLDHKFNAMLLCPACHASGKYNSHQERVKFYKKQCSRYGSIALEQWLNSLRLRVKPDFSRY